MAHVVRAWRASRMIRFLVLIAVLGTTTRVILSGGAGAAQREGARQTKIIGSDRLVSVEPLAEMNGEICVPEPVRANPELIASLQPPQPAASSLMASVLRQQSGSIAPPRP